LIWFIIKSTTKFGDFAHGTYTGYNHRPENQVNLLSLLLLLPQEQGDLASTGDEARDPFRSLADWKKHKLCLFSILLSYYYNYTSQPKGTTSLQSASYRRQWNPCHMDNLISFQRVIDRQDRTPVEGRFNYWNYRRYHYSLEYRNTPPDKDSSYVDDMPCRTPLHCGYSCSYRNDDHLARHLAGDTLRIAIATPFASHLDIQDYSSHQD